MDPLDRLRERHTRQLESLRQAQESGKFTAVAQLSAAADATEERILALEAEAAEEAAAQEEAQDPQALIGAIVEAVRGLPSHLRDDLIAALQQTQRVEPPENWDPGGS